MKIKRQFGTCRCCLKKGNHCKLMKGYYVNGKRIVYKDYFLECFNIFLSTNPKITDLICTSCIKHIRDAHSFRTLVLRNERRLLKAQGQANETEFVNVLLQPHVNIEDGQLVIKQETESDYADSPAVDLEDAVDIEDATDNVDATDSDSDSQGLVSGEKELLARFSSKPRPLPTRDSLLGICPVFYGHLEGLKDKIIEAKSIQELVTPSSSHGKQAKDKSNVAISQKLAQALNATALLENSNATVFKNKMRSGFPCFYCRNIFVNPKTLREHQTKHPKSLLFKLLSKYTADTLVVYADITDLKCIICNVDINSFDHLKGHLTEAHGKKIYKDIEDRVVPFRLEDKERNFECQVCGRKFETFGATDRHMNVHFSNYICDECGSGFVTKRRLKVHTYLLHGQSKGTVTCEPCKKVFASKFKFKIHDEHVHKKLKKMKCSECTEKFIDYFTRQRHMEEKHGVEPLSYKCTECDRSFNRKYSLTCHIKRTHLAKKDVQCEVCPYMCFNRSELRDHMFKHGQKVFECTVCKKSFARKKSLTAHMIVHSEVKRFSCRLCGETFMQKYGLLSHVKTHSAQYADLFFVPKLQYATVLNMLSLCRPVKVQLLYFVLRFLFRNCSAEYADTFKCLAILMSLNVKWRFIKPGRLEDWIFTESICLYLS